MDVVDVVIVGGGIGGLSAAHALLGAGVARVRVLEREEAPCTHASGRNAAIFRHLSATPGDFALAVRSRALMNEVLGDEAAWLRRTGAWYVAATEAPLDALARVAVEGGYAHERAVDEALWERIPTFRGGPLRHGLLSPDDGVIDIHAMAQALLRGVEQRGGRLQCEAEVAEVEVADGRVVGVRLASGQRLAAPRVVIAAGAWGEPVGAGCDAPLPLVPRRRHLVQLAVPPGMAADEPVVWSVGDELYVRPESGGLLASPCDETTWKAEVPAADPAGLELLAQKLGRLAPRLAESAVRRVWACLRTFAPDGAAVVGPDPRVAGLFWLGGLGGHGMTGGPAAGEVLAACVTGRSHPLAGVLAPARLLGARR
jgi:D-arginine dehydrogenase